MAHEETKALQATIDAACNREGSAILFEFDPESRRHLIRAESFAKHELEWGIRAGGILHNLRAALDELTWRLACKFTKDLMTDRVRTDHKLARQDRLVQFPIHLVPCDKPGQVGVSAFHGTGTGKQIRLVDPMHWTLFESHQPYSGRNGNESDPLWIPKEMNDSDKHRVIHVTCLKFGDMPTIDLGGIDIEPGMVKLYVASGDTFVQGAVVADLSDAVLSNPQMHVKIRIPLRVCFSETCEAADGLWVPKALVDMCKRVGDIIDSFAPLFP